MSSTDLKEQAERAGFSWAALRRAKRRVGVIAQKGAGMTSGWEWRAPSAQE
jgi:hypothetical protein